MVKVRGKMLSAGKVGKQALGGIMLLFGGMILTGIDKIFEAWVLQTAPEWLVNLTTSI